MVTHQGCPQTPGGRIRALGFASTRTRGRRRGPRTGERLPSDAGRAHPRTLESTHRGFASTRTRGRRRGPRTGDVSVSGLAGMTVFENFLIRLSEGAALLAFVGLHSTPARRHSLLDLMMLWGNRHGFKGPTGPLRVRAEPTKSPAPYDSARRAANRASRASTTNTSS